MERETVSTLQDFPLQASIQAGKTPADEKIHTADADVLDRLAQRFPSLEEGDVEAAATEFRRMLHETFARARQEHPDKKVIRLVLQSSRN